MGEICLQNVLEFFKDFQEREKDEKWFFILQKEWKKEKVKKEKKKLFLKFFRNVSKICGINFKKKKTFLNIRFKVKIKKLKKREKKREILKEKKKEFSQG